jgi:hypothetical protein
LEPCRGPRQLTWASQSCLAVIETDISGGGGDVITPFILDAEEGGLRQGESISGGRPLQRLVWDSGETASRRRNLMMMMMMMMMMIVIFD